MIWACGSLRINLARRPLVMGILNATPDSFSDGYPKLEKAITHADRLIAEGADILDVGGESTRPGSDPVAADEEIARVVPVIRALKARWDGPISIDTRRPEVASKAIEAGACIVNHVSASLDYLKMLPVIAGSKAGYVAMHMLEQPKTMQQDPNYLDVVNDVGRALERVGEAASRAGIPTDRLLYDPGIGFGKTLRHNLQLLQAMPALSQRLHRPLLLGVSRKSWFGKLLDAPMEPIEERDAYTAVCTVLSPFPEVAVHRVHRVGWMKRSLRLKASMQAGEEAGWS